MAATPALDRALRSGALSPASAKTVLPAMGDDGFADVADDLIGELAGINLPKHVATSTPGGLSSTPPTTTSVAPGRVRGAT